MGEAHLSAADWSWEPTVIVGLVVLSAGYVLALRRGRIGGADDVSPWLPGQCWRPVLFASGIVTAFVALLSPIDTGGDNYLLSLHMIQHLLLMMVAPPLLLLAIAGAAPLPAAAAPRLRRLWTLITRPWPAVISFNAVLLLWHLPALYDATLRNEGIHVIEHLTFIAMGLVFWWPIVDPIRRQGTRLISSMEKIAMLVVAGVPPTVLGFVFALGGTAYYDFYARAPRLWGLTPTVDQQIAGVIMFGLGNIIYFVAISIIFLRMFGNPADDESDTAGEPLAVREAVR